MFSDIISHKTLMNIPRALIQKTEMFKLTPTDCKILNMVEVTSIKREKYEK